MSGKGGYQERRRDPYSNDARQEYTYNEFLSFYGPQGGKEAWDQAGRRGGHSYRIGQAVRALTKLEGDKGQIVYKGAIGEVTALPGGRDSTVDPKAVAEVVINKVRFDAYADMIEPANSGSRGGAGGGFRSGGRDTRDRAPEYGGRQDYGRESGYRGGDYNRGGDYYGNDYRGPSNYRGDSRGAPRGGERGYKGGDRAGDRRPRGEGRPEREERRADPNHPRSRRTYTRAEFVEEYGKGKGLALWKRAGNEAPGAGRAEVEKRCDPSEPNSRKKYEKHEFIELYGPKKGNALWNDAEEKRRDPGEKGDQKYSKREFIKHYGREKGAEMWAKAEEKRRDPKEPENKKRYTQQEFIDLYGKKEGLKVWDTAGKKKIEDRKITKSIDKKGEKYIGWSREGLEIVAVEEGSPAEAAGIKPMMRIATVAGTKANQGNLTKLVSAAGEKFDIEIIELRRDTTDNQKRNFSYREFCEFYKENGPSMWKKARSTPDRPKKSKDSKKEDKEEKEEKKEEKEEEEEEEKKEEEKEEKKEA